ncbi:MAG: hypothetical protein J7K68_03655 [Candidatus Diapherotrites archaeon]|nr:hypothetical protein [Candidatus Diapherotrites archaeon]
MEKNRKELFEWCMNKAQQFLNSAHQNLLENRLFPAAEEIFRAVETTLEALLYLKGVKRIRYPGREKEFRGRLALQFLVRDELLKKGEITKDIYSTYIKIANELHAGGYMYSKEFEYDELDKYLDFAEELFHKVRRKSYEN